MKILKIISGLKHVPYLITFYLQVHILTIRWTLHHLHHLHELRAVHVQQNLERIGRVCRCGRYLQLGVDRVGVEAETGELLIHTARGRGRLLADGLGRGAQQGLAVQQVQPIDLDCLLRLALLHATATSSSLWLRCTRLL